MASEEKPLEPLESPVLLRMSLSDTIMQMNNIAQTNEPPKAKSVASDFKMLAVPVKKHPLRPPEKNSIAYSVMYQPRVRTHRATQLNFDTRLIREAKDAEDSYIIEQEIPKLEADLGFVQMDYLVEN